MKKFFARYEINGAEGSQYYSCMANNKEEALEKFKEHDNTTFEHEEVYIQDMELDEDSIEEQKE